MKKLKVILILLLSISTVTFSGCWNYTDIGQFAIVSGVAIDKSVSDSIYHLTIEVADASSGKDNPIKPIVFESDGRSIYEAISNASLKSSKKLYFSHCSLLIVSKTIARDGLIPVINCLNRDAVTKIKTNIAVSTMDTAKEVLLANPTSKKLVSYEIADMLVRNEKEVSKSPQVWLYQAADMIDGEGTSLTLPAIKTIPQETSIGEESKSEDGGSDSSSSEKSGSKSESTVIPMLAGSGVFKGDKLIGFLSPDDTQCLLFIKNEVKGGPILVNKNIDGKGVTLSITESKTNITPEVKGKDITMNIEVKVKASLVDDESKSGYNTKDKIKKLEKVASNQLNEKISSVIKSVQKDYDSDIFGFGRTIYQKNYKDWQTVENNWKENFKLVKAQVNTEIEIVNTAVEKSKKRGS